MNRISIHTILFFISLFVLVHAGIAQKTDTIIHINGNVLTGDLKKLVYGVATWKMDGMGTISVEEPKIKTIKSDKLFEIKMYNGFIYFGSFDTSNIPRMVNIVVTNGKTLVHLEEIVEIYPLRKSFWSRTSGNFSLGANFSKGSNVGTIAFSGNLSYRKRKSYYEFSWDDNNTIQADTISSSKTDINFAWQRLLKNNWSTEVAIGADQNSELGTRLRLGLNVIGLRDISYNNWNRLYTGAGLSLNREIPYDESNITNDLAGIIQVVWKVFKYTQPKVWVDANISFLPYITNSPRYRSVFNLNPKVSIFSDNFKVGFSFYYTYDSKPASTDASTTDYGINLELSYSLH
ncbi:MAG: hypothetical protein R2764_24490 [Bacteroidales bacterium]